MEKLWLVSKRKMEVWNTGEVLELCWENWEITVTENKQKNNTLRMIFVCVTVIRRIKIEQNNKVDLSSIHLLLGSTFNILYFFAT